jgi:hypothetical protein
MSGLSWLANAGLANTRVVSSAPDLVTLLLLPVSLYLVLRRRDRQSGGDRAALRRVGWSTTGAAALVYALFLTFLSAWSFETLNLSLAAFVLVGSLVVTIGVGLVSTEIWAWLLVSARRPEVR